MRIIFADNFDEVAKSIENLPREFIGKVDADATFAAAKEVERRAKVPGSYFRDKTGRVRQSIKARRSRVTNRSSVGNTYAEVTIGGAGARQGPLLELGTEKMKARAPLRRALHDSVMQQLSAAKEAAVRSFRTLARQLLTNKVTRANRRLL